MIVSVAHQLEREARPVGNHSYRVGYVERFVSPFGGNIDVAITGINLHRIVTPVCLDGLNQPNLAQRNDESVNEHLAFLHIDEESDLFTLDNNRYPYEVGNFIDHLLYSQDNFPCILRCTSRAFVALREYRFVGHVVDLKKYNREGRLSCAVVPAFFNDEIVFLPVNSVIDFSDPGEGNDCFFSPYPSSRNRQRLLHIVKFQLAGHHFRSGEEHL